MFAYFIVAAALALIGYSVGAGKKDPLRLGPGLSPQVGYQPPIVRRPPPPPRVSPLALLVRTVNEGKTPSMQLMEAAYSEAVAINDTSSQELIEWLAVKLQTPQEEVAPQAQESGEQDPEAQEGETQEPSEEAQQEVVVLSPPIPSCGPSEWETFVAAMRTRKPQWSSDKYHGAFEHNKSRLKQLGYNPEQLVDFDNQYKAFCDDILAYHKDNGGLIEEFVGDVVDVNGQMIPVTTSGVLGLLKAAGHLGARSWLTNPADRQKFPRTTEAFVRCNACF